ncbi:MAG TPA: mechanosensitive ion channel domain-containing protein [Polyangiaceae bacterium]
MTRRTRLLLRVLFTCLFVGLLGLLGLLGASPARAVEGAAAPSPEAVVRVHERAAFTLKSERSGQSATERARAASHALDAVVDQGEDPEARVEETNGVAIVFIGKTPVVTLGEEDAATSGETLHVYASAVASSASEAVRAEEKRSSIASLVFSVSLLVFSGLIAFLLFRRVEELSDRARTWVQRNPQRIPALRLRHIEVIRPNAVRGGVKIALGLGHLVAQLALGYAWLLFALSLFAATRDYTERLTGFVLTPLWALVGRVGSALPVLVVAALAALAVGVLVRFVDLFFESVAEGNTTLAWLPRDLAGPTSVLARAGIVVTALVLAAPMLTGTDDGALSRVGVAVLVSIGLSSTPMLASVVAGIPLVFTRRLPVGSFVDVGGHEGRVKEVSLLSTTLETAEGNELRVPHLITLVRPVRVLGTAAPLSVEIIISASEPQAKIRERLATLAAPYTTRTRVDLLSVDGDGARYRISGGRVDGAGDLGSAIADALREENVPLGNRRPS